MIYFGLDTSKMSDEQLMDKITELQGKMAYCQAFSNHFEQIDQMFAILEALQFEQMDRMKKKMLEIEAKRTPAIIESDPEFNKKEVQDTPTGTEKTKKKGGSSLLKQARTSKPSSNTEL